jgi:hypothetical protein
MPGSSSISATMSGAVRHAPTAAAAAIPTAAASGPGPRARQPASGTSSPAMGAYIGSPTNGRPTAASWARIWCVRPVVRRTVLWYTTDGAAWDSRGADEGGEEGSEGAACCTFSRVHAAPLRLGCARAVGGLGHHGVWFVCGGGGMGGAHQWVKWGSGGRGAKGYPLWALR